MTPSPFHPCRPCPAVAVVLLPPPRYNPWNAPLATWKALLPPTAADAAEPSDGAGGYTVTATCTGCTRGPSTVRITNVVFGDMWYCSGQSNVRPRL